jgi:hypothetical protein
LLLCLIYSYSSSKLILQRKLCQGEFLAVYKITREAIVPQSPLTAKFAVTCSAVGLGMLLCYYNPVRSFSIKKVPASLKAI